MSTALAQHQARGKKILFETGETTASGKPKKGCTRLRQLFLLVADTDHFQVTLVRRGGDTVLSVKQFVPDGSWKPFARYTVDQFRQWLRRFMSEEHAERAQVELFSC